MLSLNVPIQSCATQLPPAEFPGHEHRETVRMADNQSVSWGLVIYIILTSQADLSSYTNYTGLWSLWL